MKLIVSDFDGTYFVDDINILKNNQYIDKFRFNNNLFMLSSGRSFKSLKEMTIKYNIKYDYLSCCDGSILYDNKDNILIKFSLNNSILKKFLSLKHFAKIERIQYSYDDDYYNERKNNDLIGCNFVIKNENFHCCPESFGNCIKFWKLQKKKKKVFKINKSIGNTKISLIKN